MTGNLGTWRRLGNDKGVGSSCLRGSGPIYVIFMIIFIFHIGRSVHISG